MDECLITSYSWRRAFFKFFDGLKCAREKGEGKRTLDDDGGERAHASERLRCYNSEKELSVNVSE